MAESHATVQALARAAAREVRNACLEAALTAYEDAGIRGICEEGRIEAAVGAIRALDIDSIVASIATPAPHGDE